LGPEDIQDFFDRWMTAIPMPFGPADRSAGYFWELSVRQVEVSRTLVFDDPRRARPFFEPLVTDNVGIGRPHGALPTSTHQRWRSMFVDEIEHPAITGDQWQTADNYTLRSNGIDTLAIAIPKPP